MKNKKKNIEGEKGLDHLITYISNAQWKRLKIGFFESIKEKPEDHFKYGTLSEVEKLELNEFLNMEIICETVSYAELLGAYLLAFSKKDPIIQRTLLKYKIKEIRKLYHKIKSIGEKEIANLIGYPSLFEFEPNTKKERINEYKKSLTNIKEELKQIADFYLEYRQFYNDYKHGFRVFPHTSSPPGKSTFPLTVQIENGEYLNKFKLFGSLNKKTKEAISLSTRISQILRVLIELFNERFIENKKEFKLTLFGVRVEDRQKENTSMPKK